MTFWNRWGKKNNVPVFTFKKITPARTKEIIKEQAAADITGPLQVGLILYCTVLFCTVLYKKRRMKEEKIRKFADTQGTDKHTVQRLRPLYPLWILEGAGQQR